MAVNKNQATIDFLGQMPYMQEHPVFFNFINASDNNKQIVTMADDIALNTPFIDGSVSKRFTFTIIDYKSINYNPLVLNVQGYSDENMDDLMDVQSIIDWVQEQADNRVFPDFGEDCIIDEMEVLSNQPNLNGVDSSLTPTLAKYSISIRITYLDISKKIYK